MWRGASPTSGNGKHGLKSRIEAAARRLNRFKLGIALANKITRIAWGVLSLTFSLATHGGSIHRASPVLPLEANSRLALSTLINIEPPPTGYVSCKSMAGGRRFFQDQAILRARRRSRVDLVSRWRKTHAASTFRQTPNGRVTDVTERHPATRRRLPLMPMRRMPMVDLK